MDFWGSGQDVHQDDSPFDFHFPHERLDCLPWDNAMAVSPNETVVINQPFSICPQFWDQEKYRTENNEKEEISEEEVHLHSPIAAHSNGSTQSGLEEQHSEILCAEEQQSDVSDESRGKKSSEGETVDSKSKKRKGRSTGRGPKYVFKTRSDTDVLDDGYKWRKYGKKTIKSSPHPRSYYRCSESKCGVKKRVERDPSDREVLTTTYEGKHNHQSPRPTEIYCIADPMIVQHQGSFPFIVLRGFALT